MMKQFAGFCSVYLVLIMAVHARAAPTEGNTISLAGPWQIRMDQNNDGIGKNWFTETFTGDPATLPGTVDTNPRQSPRPSGNLAGFDPVYPYLGGVWYQREIDIPESWHGKRISLFLERCQWETLVWLDDQYLGTRNSLVAPHVYELATAAPGKHRLTILVDNANRKGRAQVVPQDMVKHYDLTTEVKDEAKLNCGGHHVMSHNWNGIVGRLELRAADPLHLAAVDVYPKMKDGAVEFRAKISNHDALKRSVRLRAACRPLTRPENGRAVSGTYDLKLTGKTEQTVRETLALKPPIDPWDEFAPNLYLFTLELIDDQGVARDHRDVRFGMRELGSRGTQFTLNGNVVFLRATLECFIFPLTGYPPTDVESWRKIIAIAKCHGLNAFRFHTCTPPDAAFQAADELGFYLQAELPGTSCPIKKEAPEVEVYLFEELKRLVAVYGNHPSLLLISMGNEQLIHASDKEFLDYHMQVLARKVDWARREDPRHLYTSASHPYTTGRQDDFYVSAWGPTGQDLVGIQWGGGDVLHASRFNTRPPNTDFDYGEAMRGVDKPASTARPSSNAVIDTRDEAMRRIDKPLLTHEVGQWAVYPDLREITRYQGALRPFNFEIIRDRLRDKGLLEFAADFTRASGKLALELYRDEIETALRTPQLGGFLLLDLHDYPGQGTSTVGILNALWESKGLTTPAEFRAFCGPVVPLARLDRRVWTTGDKLRARLELANYGPVDLPDATTAWRLADDRGRIYAQDSFKQAAPRGKLSPIGEAVVDLKPVAAPARLMLHVETLGVAVNSWDVWVYPAAAAEPPPGVTIARAWDRATSEVLAAGLNVLLVPDAKDVRQGVPGTFTTVFWNVQMKHLQVSKTMGLLCDPAHPALAEFPTEFHSNWQWWDPVMRSTAVCLDGQPPALRPIVQVVDNCVDNRRLALVFEARVGPGRLLVCSTDIVNDLATRPVARQLRHSLLDYIASPLFDPDVKLCGEDLDKLLEKR
jgi:hypothetical protein